MPYAIVGGFTNKFRFWRVHKDLPWLFLVPEEVLKTVYSNFLDMPHFNSARKTASLAFPRAAETHIAWNAL